MEVKCRIDEVRIERPTYRYAGQVIVLDEKGKRHILPMPGNVAQWLRVGLNCRVSLPDDGAPSLDTYQLRSQVTIWPPFNREIKAEAKSATGISLYQYSLIAREAIYESDYDAIVELEQYHYASEEAILAVWYCPRCHEYLKSNARPTCPRCGRSMAFHDLRDATRASRFLLFELQNRAPYEPRVLAYVRIDPPVPLMNRRLPDGTVIRRIREQVFPANWFRYPFKPDERVPATEWWEEQGRALHRFKSPVSRLARVVVHPDYRADGIGQFAVRTTIEWVQRRRIPEMTTKKQAVETVAMMARYNPFLEKAGFIYLWDTGSGRPTLYYPPFRAGQGSDPPVPRDRPRGPRSQREALPAAVFDWSSTRASHNSAASVEGVQ